MCYYKVFCPVGVTHPETPARMDSSHEQAGRICVDLSDCVWGPIRDDVKIMKFFVTLFCPVVFVRLCDDPGMRATGSSRAKSGDMCFS